MHKLNGLVRKRAAVSQSELTGKKMLGNAVAMAGCRLGMVLAGY